METVNLIKNKCSFSFRCFKGLEVIELLDKYCQETFPVEFQQEIKDYKNVILIYGKENEQISSYSIQLPLISKTQPNKKQAVSLLYYWAKNEDLKIQVVKETLMFSWELGYHAAFSKRTKLIENNFDFKPVVYKYLNGSSFLNNMDVMELSWGGLKHISRKLVVNV